MFQRTTKKTIGIALSAVLCWLLPGCGESQPELTLLDSELEEKNADAERTRLQQMQVIRVEATQLDAQGNPILGDDGKPLPAVKQEMTAEELALLSYRTCFDDLRPPVEDPTGRYVCGDYHFDPDDELSGSDYTCRFEVCEGLVNLCVAHELMNIAGLHSGPVSLVALQQRYEVPQQSTAANAAVYKQALVHVRRSVAGTLGTVLNAFSFSDDESFVAGELCLADDVSRPVTVANLNGDDTWGDVLLSTFAEGLDVHREATERAVEAIAAVGDAQRSTASLNLQISRGYSGAELSRLEAAHVLVGGMPGLNVPSTDEAGEYEPFVGLCASSELTGPAKRALRVFRDSALAPADLLNETLSIEALLGTSVLGGSPTSGSVRERLESLRGIAFDAPSDLLTHYALRIEDFVDARAYLREEFRAFSRSTDFGVPLDEADLEDNAFKSYAGTASAPPVRDPAFYAALARVGTPKSLANETVVTEGFGQWLAMDGEANFRQAALWHAARFARIINLDISGYIPEQLARLDAGLTHLLREEDGLALVRVCRQAEPAFESLFFDSLELDEKIVVVRGEDGLECGTHGAVEGMPCSPEQFNAFVTYGCAEGWCARTFIERTSGDGEKYLYSAWGTPILNRGDRLYFLKVRDEAQPPMPGNFESITGLTVEDGCVTVGVVPSLQERLAPLLRPSSDWCAQSAVSCAGTSFDERLPLENELIDDGDGVENSWRHFLTLASQSAGEADAIGEELIRAGTAASEKEDQILEAEVTRHLRINEELETLSTTCGTEINLDRLSGLGLGGQQTGSSPSDGEEEYDLETFSYGKCLDDGECEGGGPSQSYCFLGECVSDPVDSLKSAGGVKTAADHRLLECLDDGSGDEFVTAGDRTLWAFAPRVKSGGRSDRNRVCRDFDGNTPSLITTNNLPKPIECPALSQRRLVAGLSRIYGANYADDFEVFEITDTLNYFSSNSAQINAEPEQACERVRQLRGDQLTPNEKEDVFEQLKASNFFHHGALKAIGVEVGWEPRIGGHWALRHQTLPRAETGTMNDPGSSWPCGASHAVGCAGGSGLLCSTIDCNDFSERTRLGHRVFEAALALRLGSGAFEQVGEDLHVENAQAQRNLFEASREAIYHKAIPKGKSYSLNLSGFQYPVLVDTEASGNGYAVRVGPITEQLVEFPGPVFATLRKFSVTSKPPAEGSFTGADRSLLGFPGHQYNYQEYADLNRSDTEVWGVLFNNDAVFPLSLDIFIEPRFSFGVVSGPVEFFHIRPSTSAVPDRDTKSDATSWLTNLSLFDGLSSSSRGKMVTGDNLPTGLYDLLNKSPNWGRNALLGGRDQHVEFAITHKHLWGNEANGTVWVKPAGILFNRESHITDGFNKKIQALKFDNEAILDAMELACFVASSSAGGADCDSQLASPPVVDSIDDLPRMKTFFHCAANDIQARLSKLIFPKFPTRVRDALRNESAVGSSPQAGGDYARTLGDIRGGLRELASIAPDTARILRQLGDDAENVAFAVQSAAELAEFQLSASDLQLSASTSSTLGGCMQQIAAGTASGAVAGAVPGAIVGAAVGTATCANSAFSAGVSRELLNLQKKNSALSQAMSEQEALSEFRGSADNRAGMLQDLEKRGLDAARTIDSGLAQAETQRAAAKRALNRALYLRTHHAKNQHTILSTMRQRINTLRLRYEKAHQSAKRMAFLAKRAVEQRLGVRLSSFVQDMPLVEAPIKWESSICSTAGVDFRRVADQLDGDDGQKLDVSSNYADAYIGNYVRNLENFVESYYQVNNFQQGRDTAVISLKEDIYKTMERCEAPSPNLLTRASLLDEVSRVPVDLSADAASETESGWMLDGCLATGENGAAVHCLSATVANEAPYVSAKPTSPAPQPYRLVFGKVDATGAPLPCPSAECDLTHEAKLTQKLNLDPGGYLFTWYSPDGAVGVVRDPDGWPVSVSGSPSGQYPLGDDGVQSVPDEAGTWKRHFVSFNVLERSQYAISFEQPEGSAAEESSVYTVAGPMLSRLSGANVHSITLLPPYVDSSDVKPNLATEVCRDQDGDTFRGDHWFRGCELLCGDGFGELCGDNAKLYCYREASFDISQRDIESGHQFGFAGFARGNFNYRIESLAVNLVGTEVRNCESFPSSEACYAGGFVPYSVTHTGPYQVRNATGGDFAAHLFRGSIEHARGLSSERYITNPLSAEDRELISQYTRSELQGRPLDGTFTVRIWESDGIDLDAVQDIQVVLDYRYWTRFE